MTETRIPDYRKPERSITRVEYENLVNRVKALEERLEEKRGRKPKED
jgi:hypothetical protein